MMRWCPWCLVDGAVTVIESPQAMCNKHATQLYAEAFENYLKTHPQEVTRLTGEAQ